MSTARVRLGARSLGIGHPCYVIAEAGVNHNGDPQLALRLIEAAAAAGADAVKFQTFRAELLVTPAAPKAEYQTRATGAGETQLEMLKRLELPQDAYPALQAHCLSHGVTLLSTPFDPDSADMLEALAVPAFKIASGEITNLPLLRHVAAKGRPLLVSTGMATLGDVEAALQAIRSGGNPPVALLHCVSCYPAAPAEVNLRAMETLSRAFSLPVGFSDHTVGTEVALAAVALGACLVEKHLTLDKGLPGPDHQASADPAEFAFLVRGIRNVEQALGHGRKEPSPREAATAAVARRSLTAARDIEAGELLQAEMIAIRRPGTGLAPALFPVLVGRAARRRIAAGELLGWDDLR